MIVVMQVGASEESVNGLCREVEAKGLKAQPVKGEEQSVICVLGDIKNKSELELRLADMSDVAEIKLVSDSFKLGSRGYKKEDSRVKINGFTVGGNRAIVIAGPCAIESEEQALAIAWSVKRSGANVFRGGAFKPRTNPSAFQGLGEAGLKILAKVRQETGMPFITEVVDTDTFDLVEEYADILQIGMRNMQNFSLLKRAGKARKPVMLKRGQSATLQEWLMAAEYILWGGNSQVILCERGIRTTGGEYSRNILDLNVVLAVQKKSHLPIIVDPSHASGKRYQVSQLALAALVVGAHGIMIEVHNNPETALCDGAQSLRPHEFAELMKNTAVAAKIGGKELLIPHHLRLLGREWTSQEGLEMGAISTL